MAIASPSTELPQAFNDPAGNLLRPDQMTEYTQDIESTKRQLENPNVQDKGAARKRLHSLTQQMQAQAPVAITDGRLKDKLAEEGKQLLSEITVGMLSQEEMRKNPPGSVDKHLKWERINKAKIKRWKKIQLLLGADQSRPHTWDRDAANLEAYRPQGASDRMRLDAQIGGVMSYGNIPAENWQQTFGSVNPQNSALNQAKRVSEEQETNTEAVGTQKKGK